MNFAACFPTNIIQRYFIASTSERAGLFLKYDVDCLLVK